MNDLVQVKKKLTARKQEIEQELNRLNEERMNVEVVQDPTDQATLSNFEDLNISIQKTEREEYDMILKALEMIETGTYGICIDCGAHISEKRLQLYPNATRCIACQESHEGGLG